MWLRQKLEPKFFNYLRMAHLNNHIASPAKHTMIIPQSSEGKFPKINTAHVYSVPDLIHKNTCAQNNHAVCTWVFNAYARVCTFLQRTIDPRVWVQRGLNHWACQNSCSRQNPESNRGQVHLYGSSPLGTDLNCTHTCTCCQEIIYSNLKSVCLGFKSGIPT